MSVYSIPDENGNIIQMNKGELLGNVYMTHGVDFSTEQGRILGSATLKNIFDEVDDADFDNPMGAFAFYGDRWWGASDFLFKSATGYPDSTWAQDAIASTPSGDWKEMDLEVFNGLLLVTGVGASQDDIFSFNGTTWASWWKNAAVLNQSALNATVFKPIKEGATGRAYILDAQTKVYNVTTGNVVTKTGNGTLDFSATSYKLICMEPTSSRMWLGGTDTARGNAIVIEWDMSLNSATPNKIHVLKGARSVQAICIDNDNPIAVLSTGEFREFNGSAFIPVSGGNAKLPVPPYGYTYKGELVGTSTITVDSGIIHPNGWDIIDGLPHFFFNTKIVNKIGTEQGGHWNAPSGAWCLDPKVGLYCRFPVARDSGTADYAAHNVTDHGAMTFVGSGAGKFLLSAKIYSDSAATSKSGLLLQDNERSLASRGWLTSVPFQATRHDMWQNIEFLHKKLGSASDRILVKYRLNRSSTLPAEADVTWTSTTVFTTMDTDFANVVAGDEILVLRGNGAGCTAHIVTNTVNAGTYTVTIGDPVLNVSNGNTGRILVDNWRLLATISAQRVDYHDFTFPFSEDSFKIWIKLEFRNAASSQIELDKVIVNSKPHKP